MSEPYVSAPTPSPAGRKFPIVGLLIGAGVILLALVIGGAAMLYALATQRPNAIPQLLPADTQLYVAVTPNLSDVPNLERLRRAFPTENDEPVDDSLDRQLEELLGVTFETDVAPWIGTEMAVAMRNIPFEAVANATDLEGASLPEATDALFILASRDDRAAQAFLDKQRAHREGKGEQFTSSTVEGVTIYSQESDERSPLAAFALVRRHVVFATSADEIGAMLTRDPNGADTLERNPRFQETRSALPESRLAYLYLDGAPIIQAIEAAGSGLDSASAQIEEQLATVQALRAVGLSLGAEAAGFAIDAVAGIDTARLPDSARQQLDEYREPVNPERLAGISSRTLAAISFRIPASFGATLRESFSSVPEVEEQITAFERELEFDLERDLFSWFHGEATLVVLPGETLLGEESPVTGYFALRSPDPDAARAGVEKIIGVLEQVSGGELGLREEQMSNTAWQVFGPPEQVVAGYAFIADELVIGVGQGAMTAAGGGDARLDGEADFQAAVKPLPAPNGGVFYLSLGPILDLAEAQGADPEQLDGLRPFKAIAVAGTPGVDDKGIGHSRLFITVGADQ